MNRKLRFLSLLLLLAMCLSCLPFVASAETVTVTITAINAGRGEGALIVFTPDYGAKTNTNEWGVEAIVGSDNKVISVGGNNSAIPADGFVVSGHDTDQGEGKMRTWINQNIKVGSYVYYNQSTMVLTVSDQPIENGSTGFYEMSASVTGFNTTRNENAMIVYDPSYGSTTRTNEYGYELVVEDGMILSIGGNNSTIPKNGYVISGHGTSLDWLRKNARMGMRVELDRPAKTFKLIYDAKSLKAGLTRALSELPGKLEEAKSSYLYMDYARFEALYGQVKTELESAIKAHDKGGSDQEFSTVCARLTSDINKLNAYFTESYPVQYRAAWVRPSQKNAAEVDAYVKQLHDAGINTICVEGNYDNTVIMNVPKDCLFEHNPNFSYDVLQAYVDACHKYDMECHLWMAIFLVGYSGGNNYNRSLAYKKPEWLSLNQNGTPENENHFMMIDPANAEARAYLVSFYEYILKHYDIDCFELDYIRYYACDGVLDFGYTQAAFEGFEEVFHHGVTPTYSKNATYWNDWVKYRQSCVSELVREVRRMIDRVKPTVLLSADVVPTISGAGNYNYQYFPDWIRSKWLDLLHPMAYGDGFGKDIIQQVDLGGTRCMIVTGLGVFMESLGAEEMVKQSIEDNTYGAYGEAFFEGSAYLRDKAGDALLQSVYRTPALAPFLDPDASIKACLSYMSDRITDVLLPMKGVTAEQAATLQQAIEAASASVKDARVAPDELVALRSAVDAIDNKQAKARLQDDLLRAERISCVFYNTTRKELVGELEVPVNPEYPDEPDEPDVSEPEPSEPGDSSDASSDVTSENNSEQSEPTEASSSKLPLIIGGILAVIAALVTLFVFLLGGKKKQ